LAAVKLRVMLFASLRERAGADRVELELPAGALVGDALDRLAWLTGGVRVVMAVNREYAEPDQPLVPGDELALIPPVSGGEVHDHDAAAALKYAYARICAEPLSLDVVLERVRDARAGGVVAFLGVTREVPALEYEAYAEMAEAKLREILAAAIARHGLCAAAVEHRVGSVPLSEPSVTVAASAPHRAEAFAGAREIIDELKARAPIWKREGGEWVTGALPGPGTDAGATDADSASPGAPRDRPDR
jgi:molybdopterin converting factor subunit 1